VVQQGHQVDAASRTLVIAKIFTTKDSGKGIRLMPHQRHEEPPYTPRSVS
jgi:hypothetical protein